MSIVRSPGVLQWRVRLPVPAPVVFELLATDRGRERFWAERSEQQGDVVHLAFPDGTSTTLRIDESAPFERLVTCYAGVPTTFDLAPLAGRSTVLTVTARDVPAHDEIELAAGWVSVLLTLKAAIASGADLRNHDAAFAWPDGFVDN